MIFLNVDYFKPLLDKAFSDTWDLVFNQPAWNAAVGLAILATPLVILLLRKKHDDFKARLKEVGILALAYAGIFLLVFALHLFVLTPKSLVEAAERGYQSEHGARVRAEADIEKARKELAALSPSAQTDEIKRLQAAVKGFQDRATEDQKHEWPALTEQQIKEWAVVLAPHRGGIKTFMIQWGQDVDAKKLFRSLQGVGKLIGISVYNSSGSVDGNKIGVENKHDELTRMLVDLFNKAGYPAELGTDATYTSEYVAILIPERPITPP